MTHGKLQVLLVEDSKLLIERLSELMAGIANLELYGAVTTEAEAIETIRQSRPDVVVLDLRLKEGTGFGVLRFIKTLATAPVVIVVTNYALPQYRNQAILLGARFFLDKSSEFDQLPVILESLSNGNAAASASESAAPTS